MMPPDIAWWILETFLAGLTLFVAGLIVVGVSWAVTMFVRGSRGEDDGL